MKPDAAVYRAFAKEIKKKAKAGFEKNAAEEPATIALFIKGEADLFEPYSARKPEGGAAINPAIVEYLESRARGIRPGKRIIVEIEYGGAVLEDPLLPEKLIKKCLEEEIVNSAKKNFGITVSSAVSALAGIALLFLTNEIPYFDSHYAFHELFVIISWVFIWRFAERFFFERAKLGIRRMRQTRLRLAEYRLALFDNRLSETRFRGCRTSPLKSPS